MKVLPSGVVIRTSDPEDHGWITDVLTREWGSLLIAIRDRVLDASRLPALVAGSREGPATYEVDGGQAERHAIELVRSLKPGG